MSTITDEIVCYVTCVTDSNLIPLIVVLIFLAAILLITYLITGTPYFRIISFTGFQLSVLGIIATVFSAMECSRMLTIEAYIAYTTISTPFALFLPRVYHRVLIKHYNAQPIDEMLNWAQGFVEKLTDGAQLYYFDSAIPRAFASGKAIFVSIGMIELLEEEELKAVLAHEAWHIMQANKTSLLRQLSMITFTGHRSGKEIEDLADRFAENVVSKEAIDSARSKME